MHQYSLHHHHHLPHWPHLRLRGLTAHFLNTCLRNFANGLVAIFIPLYGLALFQTKGFTFQESLLFTLSYFFIWSAAALILTYDAGLFISRFGTRWAILLSNILLILKFALLILAQKNLTFFFWSGLIGGLLVPFYWISYHLLFIQDSPKKQMPRHLSFREILIRLAQIAAPLIAGFIISQWNFTALYAIAIFLIVLSSLPLFFCKHHRRSSLPSFKQIFKKILSPTWRPFYFAFFGNQAEDRVFLIIWPVFMMLFLKNYQSVGFITSAALFVSLLAIFWLGKVIQKKGSRQILKQGSLLNSSIWLIKGFFQSLAGIAFADSLHQTARNFFILPFDETIYEKAKKQTNHLEFLLLRSLSIHSASLIVYALLFTLILLNFPWWQIFLVAAFGSLLANFSLKK